MKISHGLVPTKQQLMSAIQVGGLAAAAMEAFLRGTDPVVNHNINNAWVHGTALGLPPESKATLVPGYAIYFSGGITFAYLYQRFVPTKTPATGITYALIFPMSFVYGLILGPLTGLLHPLARKRQIPKPGLFGLGMGFKAVVFSMLGHVIYGTVLGILSRSSDQPTYAGNHPHRKYARLNKAYHHPK